MKQYKVQEFNPETREWITPDGYVFDNYQDAKKKCIELVGDENYYSEPIEETEYVTPEEEGYKWNGFVFMDEKGKTKKAYTKTIVSLSEGYFGTRDKNSPWVCRISCK